MTRRKMPPAVTIEPVTRHTAEVRGAAVYRVLEKAGVPKQYAYRTLSGGEPCWTVPSWAVHAVVDAARKMRGHAQVSDAQQVMFT